MNVTNSTQPTNARYVTLAYLCGLTFILYVDRMCMGKAAPFIQQEMELSDWQMGWIHAAFTLAYGIFELPTGHLGDKYGSRSVLIRIVLWWSAFTALTGAATGFWMLTIIRFLFGAGEAGALPNASRVVDRWFPVLVRGKIRGIVHMPALLGGVVAPIATAKLIETVGWRWVFVIYGGLGIVWVAGFAWWFRETPKDHPRVNLAEQEMIGSPPVAEPATHLPIWGIITNPNIWLLATVLSAGTCTVYLTFSWYPTYLEKIHQVTNLKSGLLSSLIMLGGAIGCLVGGWLVDRTQRMFPLRWSYSLVGCSGFAFAAIVVAASVFTEDVLVKSILLSLGSFGIHVHAGAWWGANSLIGGKNSGTTFAVINSSGVFGGMLAQIGFGAVPREYWTLSFLIPAAFLAVGSLCWFFVDPRRVVESPAAASTT